MHPKTAILGSWAVVGTVITVQWISGQKPGFPPPGRYMASAVLYSLLFLAAGPLPTLSATVGAGIALVVVAGPIIQAKTPAGAKAAAGNSVLSKAADLVAQFSGQPKVA